MKIMRVFDKEMDNTKYYKYRINLPKKVVEESHLLGKEVTVKGVKTNGIPPMANDERIEIAP